MMTIGIVGIVLLIIVIGAYYVMSFVSTRAAIQLELMLFLIVSFSNNAKNHKSIPKKLSKLIGAIIDKINLLGNKIKAKRQIRKANQKNRLK